MTHNIMKRTLAGVLAVLCVASYLPANVGTGGFIGGTSIVASADVDFANVSTAAELKTAFENGGNYKLTASIALTETINVTGADVTLDLNGFDVTATDFRAFNVKAGSLTLTGAGTVSSERSNEDSTFKSTSSVIRVGDGTEYTAQGTTPAGLEIGADVTVTSGICNGISVFGGLTKETVNIYGRVEVTGEAFAITGNGTDKLVKTEINIYPGAYISSEKDVAIYHPQYGDLNITGGTIIGAGGIEAKGGISTVSITGSDTIITATAQTDHNANGSGSSTIGYAIAAVENTGYVGNPQFNISGGTITGSVAIVEDNAVADEKKGAISITGGKFITGENKTDVSAFFDGETYAQDDYGYVREISAIYWDEIEDSTGKTYYRVDPTYLTVYNGETVKLRKETTTNQIYIPSGNTGAIDLNGYDLTLNGYGFVGYNSTENNYADLTIKNSGGTATLYTTNSSNTQGFTIADYSKMTVDANVTITSDSSWTIVPKANSILDVSGTIENTNDDGYAISGNHEWSQNSVITIKNGANVIADNGVAIYHPQDGELNIEGGTITGKTALYARTGTVNISGGTFNGTGAKASQYLIADGAEATGDAVVFQSFTTSYGHAPYVTITGGTFNSTNAAAVATYEAGTADAGVAPVGFITGGSFNTELDAAYIAEGYYQDDDGDVVADERTDISNAKITVDYGYGSSSFRYGYGEYDISNAVTVKVGETTLREGEDFEIYEGTTKASDVGTYPFKIRGIGEYKGTAIGNWTISNDVYVFVAGSAPKTYSYGQAVTVNSGGTTGYWEAYYEGSFSPQTVSYSPTYSFIAQKDVELRWVEEEVAQNVEKSVLSMSTSKSTYNNKDAIKFTFNRSIDSKYTIQEIGILYGTNKLVGANTSVAGYANVDLSEEHNEALGVPDLEEALKNNTSGKVKKVVATNKNKNGVYELSYALGTNHVAYANAIGYVKVYDPTAKESKFLYTNVVATNYENA